ncbi:hypothetical protein PIIN_03907 [Serendipita indica DSM 11827]|uniref:MARVEL domain-containing protein n=1 Tax=Serendipita indica (strain DSM 11827) TaxID=1109443 RepID=G4TF84_SERID|nr:hypothetical protein PIIN_03907 [Serendipita indica DSM 11827]
MFYDRNSSIFSKIRSLVLFFMWACGCVVLGLASNFASLLLPWDSDFIIFALVVSAMTIIFTFATSLRSTPAFEAIGLFVLSVMWVAMGGFTVDRIGGVQCFSLPHDPINTGRNKTMPADTHCKQMKVIMAFSWAEFSIFVLMFIIVVILTIRARSHGAGSRVWNESISDLPWFGTWVGEDRRHYQPTYPMPGTTYAPSTYAPGSVYPPVSFGPDGVPERIVIQAPPPGQTVYLHPDDGYAQPTIQPR